MDNKQIIKLQDIIGLPPKIEHVETDTRLYDSMPILKIYPMSSELNLGVHFMKLKNDIVSYKQLLNDHGFGLSNDKNFLQYCFLNEGSISESFSNDYGESFLSKFTNTVSGGVSEVRQITNAKTLDDIQEKFQNFSKEIGSAFLGGAGGFLGEKISGGANTIIDKGQDFLKRTLGTNAAENLLIGNRVDLPQIWKGSSSTFDYNFTIRLYNPNPSDDVAYNKYIIGPIVSILLFCMPRSDDGVTYKWPFYCKINAPGMFNINHGSIKDVSITKGGDSSSFTYDQRPTIVDIKVSVSELYSVRLALEKNAENKNNIPTLENYIQSLREKKPVSKIPHYTPYQTSEFDGLKIIKKEDQEKIEKEKQILKSKSNNNLVKQTEGNRINEIVKNNIIPKIQNKKKESGIYIEKIKEKTERVVENIENKSNELKDNITKKFTDPETGDEIIRIGENTIINLTKKKAIIDENDFELKEDMKKLIKEYQNKSFNILATGKKELTETSDMISDKTNNEIIPTTTLKAGQIIEKYGNNSFVNHASKIAVFDKNDFPSSYQYRDIVRTYLKKGYNVSNNSSI